MNGQALENVICDRLKGRVDVNHTYTLAEFVTLYKDDSDFDLKDLAFWYLEGEGGKSFADDALRSSIEQFFNEAMDNTASANGYPKPVVTLGKSTEFMRYFALNDASQKESIKQEICNKLINL